VIAAYLYLTSRNFNVFCLHRVMRITAVLRLCYAGYDYSGYYGSQPGE